MLIPVETTPASVRFSLRIPKGLKKAVEWFSRQENRSENETIIQFLTNKIKERCSSESIAIIIWTGKSDEFHKYVERTEGDIETVERTKSTDLKQKTVQEPYRTVVFQTRKEWHEIDDVLKIPLKLFLSLCLHGVDPYALPPGIYEYNDPFFSDLRKHVEKALPLIKRKIYPAPSLHDLIKIEDKEDLELLSLFEEKDQNADKTPDDELPF